MMSYFFFCSQGCKTNIQNWKDNKQFLVSLLFLLLLLLLVQLLLLHLLLLMLLMLLLLH